MPAIVDKHAEKKAAEECRQYCILIKLNTEKEKAENQHALQYNTFD